MTAKEKLENLEREFADVINRNGLDSMVGMPDFVIAKYVVTTISALKTAHVEAKTHEET